MSTKTAKEPKAVKAPKEVEPKAHAPEVVEKPKETVEVQPSAPEHAISTEPEKVVEKAPIATEEKKETKFSQDPAPAVETPKQSADNELEATDGKRLDQNVEAEGFDHAAEKKAAHAKAPEVSEAVKHAVVNPNGIGSEWPR